MLNFLFCKNFHPLEWTIFIFRSTFLFHVFLILFYSFFLAYFFLFCFCEYFCCWLWCKSCRQFLWSFIKYSVSFIFFYVEGSKIIRRWKVESEMYLYCWDWDWKSFLYIKESLCYNIQLHFDCRTRSLWNKFQHFFFIVT